MFGSNGKSTNFTAKSDGRAGNISLYVEKLDDFCPHNPTHTDRMNTYWRLLGFAKPIEKYALPYFFYTPLSGRCPRSR